jgi:hypothetical protein
MGDKKKYLAQNMGKPVKHELYLAHNEVSPTKNEWETTHYELARKPEKTRPKY